LLLIHELVGTDGPGWKSMVWVLGYQPNRVDRQFSRLITI
jgi:hypothetical protein